MSISKNTLLTTLKKMRQKQDTNYAVAVEKLAQATDGFIASYVVKQNGVQVGEAINIPKDYLVKSAAIKEATDTDSPYTGAKKGDKYIDFIINTTDGAGNESHVYLAVNDLVDTYTGGDGIVVGADNAIKVSVDTANANGLAVGTAGVSLSVATTSAAGAMSAVDKTALDNLVANSDEQVTDEDINSIFA
mgnify:CR=1 FL=1